MYHLPKLWEFTVCTSLQKLFYTSVIYSTAVFGVGVWGGHLTVQDKKKMNWVQDLQCAEVILGIPVPAWEVANASRVKQITHNIL